MRKIRKVTRNLLVALSPYEEERTETGAQVKSVYKDATGEYTIEREKTQKGDVIFYSDYKLYEKKEKKTRKNDSAIVFQFRV